MKNKTWNLRGLTSLLTLAGFLIMAVTGLVLYIVPHGRIAYWTNWTFLGLTKTNWGDIHILASILFIIAGGFHTYFNWKPLLNYLRDRARGGIKLKKELAISVAAMILVTVSGIYRVPPLAYLIELNEAIKVTWIESKEYEPPFGHAELLSLRVFCKKTGLRLDAAEAELKRKGLRGVAPGRTLEQISADNGVSPLDLYRMIKAFEAPQPQLQQRQKQQPRTGAGETPRPPSYTAQTVEETFAGTGLGNKALSDIGKKVGQPAQTLLKRLADKGIKGTADESLKGLAKRHNIRPLELLKAALVPSYRPPQ